MELVTIHLECSREAAQTILPLILKARECAHSDDNKWFCFYANGSGGFQIGNVTFHGEDDEKSIALNKDVDSQQSIWGGGAIFVYELDGETYEHKESEVVFSDATE